MDYENIFNSNVNDVIADREQTRDYYVKERRERFAKCHRSRNGLLPAEILMIYYARSYTTDQTDFQAFWYYDYGVTNPQKILQKLSREGFIFESEPYENVATLRVVELKELLKKAGLKLSGRKQELIDRLLENVDEQFLNENIESRKYKLTEKGQTELNYNEYVIYFHKDSTYSIYNIDIFWANELLYKNPFANFRREIGKKLWEYEPIAKKEAQDGYIRAWTQHRYTLSNYYHSESNLEKAFFYFAEGVFYAMNYEAVDKYKKFLKLKNSDVTFNAEMKFEYCFYVNIHYFEELYKTLNIGYEELKKLFVSVFVIAPCDERIISDNDLSELLISLLNNDVLKSKAIYESIEKKIKNELNEKNHDNSNNTSNVKPEKIVQNEIIESPELIEKPVTLIEKQPQTIMQPDNNNINIEYKEPKKFEFIRKIQPKYLILMLIFTFILIAVIASSLSSLANRIKKHESKPVLSNESIATSTVLPQTTTATTSTTMTTTIATTSITTIVTTTTTIETTTVTTTYYIVNENLQGRGEAEENSGRTEPNYINIFGYVTVYGFEKEHELESTSNFADETLWTIPTYEKDKQFWNETGIFLQHKTEVAVREQFLKHEGWGSYSGYLLVEKLDDGSEYYINVKNFITKPYWTYQNNLDSAASNGYYIAEYHQQSDYYPVDNKGKKVEMRDGIKVLVTGKSGTTSYYSRSDNSIEARVWDNWDNGYPCKEVHFNSKDLTIIY